MTPIRGRALGLACGRGGEISFRAHLTQAENPGHALNNRFFIFHFLPFMKTNSQFPIASWLYLGDLDGDGIEEVLQINGPYLSVLRPDFELSPRFTHQFSANVQRLVLGNFNVGDRREQVGAILADGSIQFFGLSPDRTVLWWWMTMPTFIAHDEHYIVGDYDGDGADEIMVFKPSDGSVRMYQIGPSGFFEQMANFQPGNLAGLDLRGKQILAGGFGDTLGRKDILVIDPHHRQVFRYASVTLAEGVVTFWWAFTTIAGLFNPGDQVVAANLNGSRRDGVLIRNTSNGTYRMHRAEYDNGHLAALPGVAVGQLPVQANVGRIVAAKVRDQAFRRERGGLRRDDVLFFDEGTRQLIRTDARYDAAANQLTYWWAFTSERIFVGHNFTFDARITANQVMALLERHRFAYFQSFGCNNLNDAEKQDLVRAYRKAIRHGIDPRPGVNASAFINGDILNVNFNVLFPQGGTEIAQTLIHEMMHCAGYSHPNRQPSDSPFDGGTYYNSPPLRAEICIAGFQSDLEVSAAADTKAGQQVLLHLEQSHCEVHEDGCVHKAPQTGAAPPAAKTDQTKARAEKMAKGIGKA
jgi:hypothetical protein